MKDKSTGATIIPLTTGCDRCRTLENRLHALQAERDELVLALARERQRANSVVLEFPTVPLRSPTATAPQGPAPLRHQIADRLNDSMKGILPFAHIAAAETRTHRVLVKVPSTAGANVRVLVKSVEALVLTSIALVEAVTTRFVPPRFVPVTV
jgi:hypothetical protein